MHPFFLKICFSPLPFFWKSGNSEQKAGLSPWKQVDISIKISAKNRRKVGQFLALQRRKKAVATLLSQPFGGSWWIRTTEALSSRFTVCPHWPLGKAPIFCFVSAASPGDVCYYSKAEPEMQAFFSIFLRFFQKSLFPSQHRVKTFLDIRFGLAYIYNII